MLQVMNLVRRFERSDQLQEEKLFCKPASRTVIQSNSVVHGDFGYLPKSARPASRHEPNP